MRPRFVLAWILLAPISLANQQCATAGVPVTTTNWIQTLSFPRFDPALGTLNSVQVSLVSMATGSVGMENLDIQPATATTSFSVQTTLTRPDNSILLIVLPLTTLVDNLAAFDGTIDFAGTSGVTHVGITAQATVQGQFTSVGDLALFSGPVGNPGTINLPISCNGTTSWVGVNIVQASTSADANVSICYDYTPPAVPFCFGDGSGTACPCGNASAVGGSAGCLNSTGVGAKLVSSGLASVAHDTLVLTCTRLPAAATALFIQGGTQQVGGAGSVFGDGLRCAGFPVVRVHIVTASGGIASYPQGGQTAISVLGGVVANAARHYQTWYRNAASFCTPSTFNLSQGLTVTWSP